MPCHGFGSLSCLVHLLAKRPNLPAGITMGRMAAQRSREGPLRQHGQPVRSANVNQQLFSPLPVLQSRGKLFLTIWSAQAITVLCLISLHPLFPRVFSAAAPGPRKTVITLVPFQSPLSQQPQPVAPHLIIRPRPAQQMPAVARLTVPSPEPKPRESEVKTPELKIESKFPAIPGPPASKVVATDTFSSGRSIAVTTDVPAIAVQTGGFGDPNGVPARDKRGATSVLALGSFDLPGGSGHGDGSGGANRGAVLSSGFGDGVVNGNATRGGVVQQSGFDSKHAGPEPPKASLISGPASTPVQIFSKPNPEYTEEGRRLKIDGEVRLEVLFSTSGQVHVVRILQGLGHGLDEEAVKAAQQIRFKPASHQGQPVDSTAVVHIIFQLAS
jgi:TonB family protein